MVQLTMSMNVSIPFGEVLVFFAFVAFCCFVGFWSRDFPTKFRRLLLIPAIYHGTDTGQLRSFKPTTTTSSTALSKPGLQQKHDTIVGRKFAQPSMTVIRTSASAGASTTTATATANVAREVGRLEALCEARTKELNYSRMQLKQCVVGFDSLAVIIQYLTQELNAFSVPELGKRLQATNNELQAAREHLERDKVERRRLRDELSRSSDDRERAIGQLSERMRREANLAREELVARHDSRLDEMREFHKKEIDSLAALQTTEISNLQKLYDERLDNINLANQAEQTEHLERYMLERQELINARRADIKLLRSKHDEVEAGLRDEIKELVAECEALKCQTKSLKDELTQDSDYRVQAATSRCNALQNEVDSLKVVLEMRLVEVQELRREKLELSCRTEDLSAAKDTIRKLEAKNEDLEARLDIRLRQEKILTSEHQTLLESLKKESYASKRLSLENEELQWKLQNNKEMQMYLASIENSDASSNKAEPNSGSASMYFWDNEGLLNSSMNGAGLCSSPRTSFSFFKEHGSAKSAGSPSPRGSPRISPCKSPMSKLPPPPVEFRRPASAPTSAVKGKSGNLHNHHQRISSANSNSNNNNNTNNNNNNNNKQQLHQRQSTTSEDESNADVEQREPKVRLRDKSRRKMVARNIGNDPKMPWTNLATISLRKPDSLPSVGRVVVNSTTTTTAMATTPTSTGNDAIFNGNVGLPEDLLVENVAFDGVENLRRLESQVDFQLENWSDVFRPGQRHERRSDESNPAPDEDEETGKMITTGCNYFKFETNSAEANIGKQRIEREVKSRRGDFDKDVDVAEIERPFEINREPDVDGQIGPSVGHFKPAVESQIPMFGLVVEPVYNGQDRTGEANLEFEATGQGGTSGIHLGREVNIERGSIRMNTGLEIMDVCETPELHVDPDFKGQQSTIGMHPETEVGLESDLERELKEKSISGCSGQEAEADDDNRSSSEPDAMEVLRGQSESEEEHADGRGRTMIDDGLPNSEMLSQFERRPFLLVDEHQDGGVETTEENASLSSGKSSISSELIPLATAAAAVAPERRAGSSSPSSSGKTTTTVVISFRKNGGQHSASSSRASSPGMQIVASSGGDHKIVLDSAAAAAAAAAVSSADDCCEDSAQSSCAESSSPASASRASPAVHTCVGTTHESHGVGSPRVSAGESMMTIFDGHLHDPTHQLLKKALQEQLLFDNAPGSSMESSPLAGISKPDTPESLSQIAAPTDSSNADLSWSDDDIPSETEI